MLKRLTARDPSLSYHLGSGISLSPHLNITVCRPSPFRTVTHCSAPADAHAALTIRAGVCIASSGLIDRYEQRLIRTLLLAPMSSACTSGLYPAAMSCDIGLTVLLAASVSVFPGSRIAHVTTQ